LHLTVSWAIKHWLKGYYEPLEIGGDVIYLDTTDFNAMDYEGLYEEVQGFIY